jgi:hypothetical protein
LNLSGKNLDGQICFNFAFEQVFPTLLDAEESEELAFHQ